MFEELMALVNTCNTFMFKDYPLDNRIYRIFSYGLPRWSHFELPFARETRGTMFDITDPDSPLLVARPFEKFFNYDEGSPSIRHDVNVMTAKMEKLDGSIISSFIHNGQLYLKSNNSLTAEQISRARHLLAENSAYEADILNLTINGFTVNMEYTAPTNQCVIYYESSSLTVLSIRSRETGELFVFDRMIDVFDRLGLTEVGRHVVNATPLNITGGAQIDFIESIKAETVGEGYVIVMTRPDNTQYLVKVKNNKYCHMHLAKSPASLTDERLVEGILMGISDDLRAMFSKDVFTLDRITKMEDEVLPVYNQLVKSSEAFYHEHKGLNRKDYMIKVQSIGLAKALAIQLFLGKPTNPQEVAIKNMKAIYGHLFLGGAKALP
jgi:T4 RnlA family RNA ligase